MKLESPTLKKVSSHLSALIGVAVRKSEETLFHGFNALPQLFYSMVAFYYECDILSILIYCHLTNHHEKNLFKKLFYTRLQIMTFLLVSVLLLLLCPVSLGASASGQLEEMDSVIIHEADMKDMGKLLCFF